MSKKKRDKRDARKWRVFQKGIKLVMEDKDLELLFHHGQKGRELKVDVTVDEGCVTKVVLCDGRGRSIPFDLTIRDLDEDKEVVEKYRNHYHCTDCDEKWTDTWDSMCNDRCPSCNKEIEPYKSEELDEEGDTIGTIDHIASCDKAPATGDEDDEDEDRKCAKSPTGGHVPDWSTITPADGVPGTVDVACKHCGRSGSFAVDLEDINW